VCSAGPHKINSFTAAFCNSAENYLKQKGYRVMFKKLPSSYILENIKYVKYYAYFSGKNEPTTSLTAAAQMSDIEIGIFRS
jgi:hypothetical protein